MLGMVAVSDGNGATDRIESVAFNLNMCKMGQLCGAEKSDALVLGNEVCPFRRFCQS